jgi:zinc/manganese transport system substrate-binding protein
VRTAPTNFSSTTYEKAHPSPFKRGVLSDSATAANAKLKVVATLPDLASLAREIGGDKVEVSAMAKPTEDPHFVDARPSFVVQLRDADVLIDGGRGT